MRREQPLHREKKLAAAQREKEKKLAAAKKEEEKKLDAAIKEQEKRLADAQMAEEQKKHATKRMPTWFDNQANYPKKAARSSMSDVFTQFERHRVFDLVVII